MASAEFVLKNGNGMEVRVLRTGAILKSVIVPDRNGNLDDVVYGFDDPGDYLVPVVLHHQPTNLVSDSCLGFGHREALQGD